MKIISIILTIIVSSSVFSQSEENYSGHPYAMMGTYLNLNTTQGSARYTGTGGVISTVGGDISNLNTNPAGLGMFSRTELQITPNIQVNNVNSDFRYISGENVGLRSNNDKSEMKFTLNNIGGVFSTRRQEEKALRASNIAVGINRTHNFNRNIVFETRDNFDLSYAKSLARNLDDAYQNLSDQSVFPINGGIIADDYYDYGFRNIAAFDGQLLYYNSASNIIESPVTGTVDQVGYKKIRGGVNELAVAWAGNFNDKYYLGVTLGVPILNYRSEFEVKESDVGQSNSAPNAGVGQFVEYNMSEFDEFTGAGVNLKVGGLVKLTKALKASAYIHTPTYYEITNEYQIGMYTRYENSTIERQSEILRDEFQIVTPFRFGGGLSYLFKKRGFIGAEYEFSDVGSTLFMTANTTSENAITRSLNEYRTGKHTLRVGGEFVLGPGRIRAGYNLMTSPFTNNVIAQRGDLMMHTYTLGAGIRGDQVSLDLAFARNQFRDYNTFYETDAISEVGIASWNTQNQVSLTLNYRFE